jgi:alkylation response protein AidB-like acyl-CoA dehydrogenase
VIAKPYGDGYVLNGTKCFISGGDIAQKITVFAALENKGFESWTAFVVDANNIGLKAIHTELKMGMRASTAAELCFSDAYVAKEDIVGGLEQGWALNRSTLNASRYPVAAMGVGLARRACELALDFCCRTTLANKPLIAYQDIQLQIAQMIAQTRAMRSLLWQQAHSMQPIQSEASMSKFYITDKAQEVCEMAMMIMGEHAVSTSCGIEKLLRDVRLTRIFEGTNQINRLSVIEDMQPFLLDKINGRNVHISV